MDENLKHEIIDKFFNGENKEEVELLEVIISKGLNTEDENVKKIFSQVCKAKDMDPRFNIFISEEMGSAYMANFKALNINKKDIQDFNTIFHEYGHAMFNIALNTTIPDDYDKIVENAKKAALSNANFRPFLESMCKKKEKTKGTELVSDIVGAMWQTAGFPDGRDKDSPFMLPYIHPRSEYVKDDVINYNKVYDEQFANFFSLKANNCHEELDTLRDLFGDEWFNSMEETIQKINEVIKTNNNTLS